MKSRFSVSFWCLFLLFGLTGLGLVFSAGAAVSSGAGQVSGGSFQGLGFLPGADKFRSIAWDVSADGTAVTGQGWYSTWRLQAFHWTEATGMVSLPFLPGGSDGGNGDGISADGTIVAGGTQSFESWPYYGGQTCIWTFDRENNIWVVHALGDLTGGDFNSCAYHITPDGSVVVGEGSSAKGLEACRWTFDGAGWTLEGLGDLPGGDYKSGATGCSTDGSVVVGQSRILRGSRAFRWTSATGMVNLGALPKHKFSAAWACSADGNVVVGESFAEAGKQIAFRWTAAKGMVGLGDLPGGVKSSEADGVSADGSIMVGGSGTANGVEAFIWDAANGMRRLADVLSANGVSVPLGWTLQYASSVTVYSGMVIIVGSGINPDGNTEAWRAVIAQ